MKNIVLNIQKVSKNSSFLIVSKMSLSKYFLTLFFIMLFYSLSSSAQQCSLTLSAKNNIESVNSQGRVYFIMLQNKTNEEININLSVSNNNIGNNPDETAGTSNVNLNAEVLNQSGQALTGIIALSPNEIFEFQVKVTVPAGTPLEHWNNTLLRASSDKCANYSTSLNLFTFIPIPE
jgi:hypothetical protein